MNQIWGDMVSRNVLCLFLKKNDFKRRDRSENIQVESKIFASTSQQFKFETNIPSVPSEDFVNKTRVMKRTFLLVIELMVLLSQFTMSEEVQRKDFQEKCVRLLISHHHAHSCHQLMYLFHMIYGRKSRLILILSFLNFFLKIQISSVWQSQLLALDKKDYDMGWRGRGMSMSVVW